MSLARLAEGERDLLDCFSWVARTSISRDVGGQEELWDEGNEQPKRAGRQPGPGPGILPPGGSTINFQQLLSGGGSGAGLFGSGGGLQGIINQAARK